MAELTCRSCSVKFCHEQPAYLTVVDAFKAWRRATSVVQKQHGVTELDGDGDMYSEDDPEAGEGILGAATTEVAVGVDVFGNAPSRDGASAAGRAGAAQLLNDGDDDSDYSDSSGSDGSSDDDDDDDDDSDDDDDKHGGQSGAEGADVTGAHVTGDEADSADDSDSNGDGSTSDKGAVQKKKKKSNR